ncbi:caspase family protein [Streptomyces sp. NBC_01283]|uniref:caspase family protein n=1 Tax=Streptomyces sp. NBC_01283 TaxID=2903812 RepID=UPI00352D6147|nr:caspase family protein [Streptomyces sp. NBC_01283]
MARRALVVAASRYDDPRLEHLPGADADALALSEVLRDGAIGGFEVGVLKNRTRDEVARSVQCFFNAAAPEDLLLLHLSCHGIKDSRGRLHFAARDTEVDTLEASSLDADFLNDRMEQSASQQIILLLDCCYSGAFVKGLRTRAGEHAVDVAGNLGGRGRFIITSSTSLQYSHEDGERSRDGAKPSVFTTAVVQSLRHGTGDRDGDGRVGAEEFYRDVCDRVRRILPDQTPTLSVNSATGDLVVAFNPAGPRPSRPAAVEPVAAATPEPGLAAPSTNFPFDPVKGSGYDIGEVMKHLNQVIDLVSDSQRTTPVRPPYFSEVSGKRGIGYDKQQVDAHIERHLAEPADFEIALRRLLREQGAALIDAGTSVGRRVAKLRDRCHLLNWERLIGHVGTGRIVNWRWAVAYTSTHLCVLDGTHLLRVSYRELSSLSVSSTSRWETWSGSNDQAGWSGETEVVTTTVRFGAQAAVFEEPYGELMRDALNAFVAAMADLRKRHPDWFA